jgi:dihydrofolate reductase
LKDRINIIISSTLLEEEAKKQNTSNCELYISSSLALAIKNCQNSQYGSNIGKIFICGGKNIYHEAIKLEIINEISLTHIHHDYKCDVVLDHDLIKNLLKKFTQINKYSFEVEDKSQNINKIKISFSKLVCQDYKNNINNQETQYLDMLYDILKTGHYRKTRNEYTFSKFAKTLEFDLEQGFPLLTTKKMFFKGIVEELLWFLRGSVNSKELEAKGVNIWKENSSRKYLDDNGFSNYEEANIVDINCGDTSQSIDGYGVTLTIRLYPR